MKPAVEDPIRLASSSDDPLLREALRAAGDELATSEQLAAVAAKLGPILGGGPGGGDIGGSGGANVPSAGAGGGASALGSSLMGGASAKVALVVGAGALVSIGLLATRADDSRPPTKVALPPTNVPASAASPASTSVAPAASVSEAAPTSPSVASSPSPAALPRAPSVRALPTETAPAIPAPPQAPQESEVKILSRAQEALRSDPALALSICDDHAKRFPSGLLPQEREVIAIDALTRLGRKDAARARARLFRAAHPSSSHLGRIEVLVGTGF